MSTPDKKLNGDFPAALFSVSLHRSGFRTTGLQTTKTENMGKLIHSFGPVADDGCRILVLGTMPGEESLRKQQYYGHPRNAFWPIMAALCGRELPDAYEQRKNMLLETRIALWDVCRLCEREGSLDSNICNEAPNRIGELLRQYPQIRTIFFNGQNAARLFKRYFPDADPEIARIVLPSTSPAHAVPLEKKLQAWQVINDLLK